MAFSRLKFNLANTPIRHDTLHGKAYTVAPMVMITEGVHNGSGGALLYTANEIKKTVQAWNHKPIVVYHPSMDGKGISACDPTVLNQQQVGIVLHSKWSNGKLRAEAWIENGLAEKVDARVLTALETNQMMEVSTGLFTETHGDGGKWNDEEYIGEAVNHQPDHLALLPDQIGACSIADGAGLLQMNEAASAYNLDATGIITRGFEHIRRMVGNAMSNANIYAALSTAIRTKYPKCSCWIVDVYPDFFVAEADINFPKTALDAPVTGIKLWKFGYSVSKNVVTLEDADPVEVVRVTEYRTADTDKFVGNETHQHKEKNVEKKALVDSLIANDATSWEETDRNTLMCMDEAVLNKMALPKKGKKKTPPAEDTEGDDMGDVPANNSAASATNVCVKPKTGKQATTTNAAPTAPLTAQQYIDNAPPEIRAMLTNGLTVYADQKKKLIDVIVANAANKFTPEFLQGKEVAELEGIAALANNAAPRHTPQMFYGGMATAHQAPITNAEVTEGPLPLPTMDFANRPKR